MDDFDEALLALPAGLGHVKKSASIVFCFSMVMNSFDDSKNFVLSKIVESILC